MTRRQFTAAFGTLPALAFGEEAAPVTVRGKLTQAPGQDPVIVSEGRRIRLEGDEQTSGVLRDERLNDIDFEVIGHWDGTDKLKILPIHKRALFVHKDGKRLYVTYWCDICAIRTYTPGVCWCCQDQTALDLKEKLDN